MQVGWKTVDIVYDVEEDRWELKSFYTAIFGTNIVFSKKKRLFAEKSRKLKSITWSDNPPRIIAVCGVLEYLNYSLDKNAGTYDADAYPKNLKNHGSIPGKKHTCGIYATNSIEHLYDNGYEQRGIMIQVALSGKIIVHEKGYRAAVAEVMQIAPYSCRVCSECGTNIFLMEDYNQSILLCDHHLEKAIKDIDNRLITKHIHLDELARRLGVTVAWDSWEESKRINEERLGVTIIRSSYAELFPMLIKGFLYTKNREELKKQYKSSAEYSTDEYYPWNIKSIKPKTKQGLKNFKDALVKEEVFDESEARLAVMYYFGRYGHGMGGYPKEGNWNNRVNGSCTSMATNIDSVNLGVKTLFKIKTRLLAKHRKVCIWMTWEKLPGTYERLVEGI